MTPARGYVRGTGEDEGVREVTERCVLGDSRPAARGG